MALLKIGGTDIPTPATYKIGLADLDSPNTKRTEDGVMHRDRIRAGAYKITVGWEALTPAQLQTITAAIAPEEFTVVFFDATTYTENKTVTMYSGNREAELVRKMDENNKAVSYWNYSTTLTEY